MTATTTAPAPTTTTATPAPERTRKDRVVYTVEEALADATRTAMDAIDGSLSGSVALGHHLARAQGKVMTAYADDARAKGNKAVTRDSFEARAMALPAIKVLVTTMALKYGVCQPTPEAAKAIVANIATVKADFARLPKDGGTAKTGGLEAMLAAK
jgi:hypothetical protein